MRVELSDGGATNGQLIQEAWALLPDAYVDVKQARATVAELQRRVSSLTPFALDDFSVPVLQPHWRLAFSGGTGTEIRPFYEAGAASIRSFVPCARGASYVAADLRWVRVVLVLQFRYWAAVHGIIGKDKQGQVRRLRLPRAGASGRLKRDFYGRHRSGEYFTSATEGFE